MSESPENINQQYANPYPYFYYPAASPAYYPGYTYRQMPQQSQMPQQNVAANVPGMLPIEQSYIENILRLNRGKRVTVYMTFEGGAQANQKVFKGVIEAAGRDHLILSDPQTGKRYLLLMVYLDYVVFDEEINYSYPFSVSGQSQLSAYPPR